MSSSERCDDRLLRRWTMPNHGLWTGWQPLPDFAGTFMCKWDPGHLAISAV
jgi:hypothetical protein